MGILRDALTAAATVLRSWRGAVMVQQQSMGLWEGKQFRMYRPYTVTQQFRFNAAKPFMLSEQSLYIDNGEATLQVFTGSTPSGVWTNIAEQTGKNRLPSVTYVQQNFVQEGGTFTGGTERELFRADSGSGQGVAFSNIDGRNTRVLPAGIYYFSITVTGTTAGIYSFEWEELD